jgi:hypothetical protein
MTGIGGRHPAPNSLSGLLGRVPARPRRSARASRCLTRVPSRATPGCAFAHGLQLGSDLLQRAIGRRRLDAGDEPDQPIVALRRPSAIQ